MTNDSVAQRARRFWRMPNTQTAVLIAGYVVAGAGFAIAILSFADGIARDGGFAYDFSSYYLAGQRYLAGESLYTPVEINDPGAYRYLPTFAAVMAPLTVVPEPILTWVYRGLCIGCIWYLVGSWKAVGWSLLFPPVLIELWSLNLTLPLAAGARWALRGEGAVTVPAQGALKYASVLLIPYLWIVRPALRRALVVGSVITGVALLVHAALDPAAWRLFVESLGQQARSTNDAPYIGDQLLFIVPSTLGDFVLRFAVAIVLTVIAIRYRRDWLVFAAITIAAPTLWLARLAPLIGVPRLMREAGAEAHRSNSAP